MIASAVSMVNIYKLLVLCRFEYGYEKKSDC